MRTPAMHVFVVIHDFQPGGVERIATRLATQWASTGLKITLICGRPVGALKSLMSDRVSLVSPVRQLKRGPFSRLRLAAFVACVAKQERPHVIFLPGNFYAAASALIRLLLGVACPRIVCKLSNPLRRSDRGTARQRLFDRSIRWKTNFCDHLVFMSPELQQEAIGLISDVSTKSSVIDEPILDSRFEPPGRMHVQATDDTIKLVAASRLVHQKRLDVMITAMAMIGNRSIRLKIFGEGPCRKQLEGRIASLGLDQKVELVGYSDDWRTDLQDARLYLLSSEFEGFPAVVIEALASGVPVVATNCSPAMHSILSSSQLGSVVDKGNPESFADAVDRQLDSPRPDPMHLAKSVERFRLESSAAAYVELFDRLATASPGVTPA